ncbi:MAG: hypothetical protein GY870_08860 [archaeon]|nr:hypothetical protein [archaeon]
MIASVLGIVLSLVIFVISYEPMQQAEANSLAAGLLGAEGCILAVEYILPFICDLGVASGVLFAACAIGYLQDEDWAFPASVLAIVWGLISFWAMVPAMATDNPPYYTFLFAPLLVIYFILMNNVGKLPLKVTILGLFTGMAYVTAFMNGVASFNRIIVVGSPIFTAIMRLNWAASFGFAVITIGVLLNSSQKDKLRIVGIVCAILEGIVGTLAGMNSPFGVGFSMFYLAPILALATLPIFAMPKLYDQFFSREDKE